jgi:AAHS family 3-hydroxyphenylpropionic acid transporter
MRGTVALCFAVAVLEGFDIQALGVAAPKLVPEFGLSPQQMGFVSSVSNAGFLLGAGAGGWLADQFGRKRVLVISTLTFALFTLGVAVVKGFEGLFVARLLTGFGFGAAMPNLMALASEAAPRERRVATTAFVFCGMPTGGGASALLTQFLPPDYDWRLLFQIGGVLPLVIAVAVQAWLVEPPRPAKGGGRPERRPVATVLFGEGRAAPTLLMWLTFLPTVLILYLLVYWLPLLVAAKGIDRALAPQASVAFNWGSVVGSVVLGGAVDRFGSRWPFAISFSVLVAALAALAAASSLGPVLVLSAITGFCLLGSNYALYGVAAPHYPVAERATGSGAAVAVGRVGSILGPLLAGFWREGGASADAVLLYTVPLAALAGLAVFALSAFPARH